MALSAPPFATQRLASAQLTERQMDTLSEDSREKILGLNTARVFKLTGTHKKTGKKAGSP